MAVFAQRVGDDLYVGEAYDDESGQLLIEVRSPTTYRDLHARFVAAGAAPYTDCTDIDVAFYEADNRPDSANTEELRSFFLLRVRARAGLASAADAAWVLDQLKAPDSTHRTIALISALGDMGPDHEDVLAGFLTHANDDMQADYAMRALIRLGLADKYADTLVDWMQGGGPPQRFRGLFYGLASHALRLTHNPKLLRAFVEAAKDTTEKWTSREHALRCLSSAIDLEDAPFERLPPDDPYMQSVLARAEAMLTGGGDSPEPSSG